MRKTTPIVPKSWYHICVGIDTISGLLRIVDNGDLANDEENELLRNTSSIKPENVTGNLFGKGSLSKVWGSAKDNTIVHFTSSHCRTVDSKLLTKNQ